ncbi:GPP34 family phosphoprotein [Streptacidiphilus sp. 4-A2]|nr:GPP34 family phosphoprotein [Streptacidiphilus sp. 4-A2]
MDLPETLPARLYLLAYLPAREHLAQRTDLGLLLRAAVLADLLQRGLVRDEKGAPVPDLPAPALLDPLLAPTLEEIAESRPRRWERWITHGNHGAVRAVRDRLVEDGVLDLEQRRLLGLFPGLRPVLPDPEVRERLLAGFTAALTDPLPQVRPGQAALVALVAEGRLRHLLPARERHARRERIGELAVQAGPVPHALRKALRARHSSYGGG